MAQALKVLFAGDVGGHVDALFKRVAAVNASNGPFDLLLCTGGFFAAGAQLGGWRGRRVGAAPGRQGQLAGPSRCPLPPPVAQHAHRRCVSAPSPGPDEGDYAGELLPYIKGEKQAPVPTWFIGGWGRGSRQALDALAGAAGGGC